MRFPKPFFWASKGAWYLQIGKLQISLGKDRDEAFERYREILLHEQGQAAEPALRRLTVAQGQPVPVPLDELQGAGAIVGHVHPIAEVGEDVRQGSTGVGIVVHVKNMHASHWRTQGACGAAVAHVRSRAVGDRREYFSSLVPLDPASGVRFRHSLPTSGPARLPLGQSSRRFRGFSERFPSHNSLETNYFWMGWSWAYGTLGFLAWFLPPAS